MGEDSILLTIKSFTDLQTEINNTANGGILILEGYYKYNSNLDSNFLQKGVLVNKNITIFGNGCVIDGNNTSSLMEINANNNTVKIYDLNFINGHQNTWNYGRVSITNSIAYFNNCSFLNSTNGYYGSVYIAKTSQAHFNNCIFNNNYAKFGGAIFNNNIMYCKNCSFENNSAQSGGSLCINGENNGVENTNNYTYLENCSFSDNSSTAHGAVIYCDEWSKGCFNNCSFEKNSATTSGGAITIDGANIDINNCSFNKNKTGTSSTYNGGAIWIIKNDISGASNVNILNTSFSNNSASQDGGAIYLNGTCVLKISNSSFNNNTATRYGGSIRNYQGTATAYLCGFLKSSDATYGTITKNGCYGP